MVAPSGQVTSKFFFNMKPNYNMFWFNLCFYCYFIYFYQLVSQQFSWTNKIYFISFYFSKHQNFWITQIYIWHLIHFIFIFIGMLSSFFKKKWECYHYISELCNILHNLAFKIWLVNSRKVFLSHLATVLFSKSWIARGRLFFHFMKFSPTPQNRNYIQDCM